MTITPDEARLKELIKSAVKEALDERQYIKARPPLGSDGARTLRVIALWVLILATAVGLYNLLE
jgi:hypothetical protein